MSDTKTHDIDAISISSWAAPTSADIAVLEGLTEKQYRALLRREIRVGFESGVTEKTMNDVWDEAVRRVRAKSRNAL